MDPPHLGTGILKNSCAIYPFGVWERDYAIYQVAHFNACACQALLHLIWWWIDSSIFAIDVLHLSMFQLYVTCFNPFFSIQRWLQHLCCLCSPVFPEPSRPFTIGWINTWSRCTKRELRVNAHETLLYLELGHIWKLFGNRTGTSAIHLRLVLRCLRCFTQVWLNLPHEAESGLFHRYQRFGGWVEKIHTLTRSTPLFPWEQT